MKQFAGFPSRMQFTPVPDFFFSALLPQITDIAELKTTLHIFKALYRKRGSPRFTTYRELLGDKGLVNSLREGTKSPDEMLHTALEMAAQRGTILHLALDRDGFAEDVYFLNTEDNKEIVAKVQSGELSLAGLKVKDKTYPEIEPEASPDIFTLYEENIGMLTPMIADELREAEKLYPAVWIKDAVKEAVDRNKRSWRYIAAILERWTAEGRDDGTYRRDSAKKTDPNKYIKGKYGHLVRR